MKQNMLAIIERKINSVKCIYVKTVLQMNLRGNSRGILHVSQGGLSKSSPIRSDGSEDSQTGRLSHVSSAKSNSRGAIRLESAQVRRFS